MGEMLSTKEVAKFLNINEKMVYTLIAEKGLPASKVTGKWLFPINLVRQWIEAGTENFPELATLPPYHGIVLIAGSNDLLLDKIISTFGRSANSLNTNIIGTPITSPSQHNNFFIETLRF